MGKPDEVTARDPEQYESKSRVTQNNEFTHNTIELGWRAGGIGFFGGVGYKAENNLITGNFRGRYSPEYCFPRP